MYKWLAILLAIGLFAGCNSPQQPQLSVAEYIEQTCGPDVVLSEEGRQSIRTWGDWTSYGEGRLDRLRSTVGVPGELAEYHAARIATAEVILGTVEVMTQEEAASLIAVAMVLHAAGEHIYETEKSAFLALPEELQEQLLDGMCKIRKGE